MTFDELTDVIRSLLPDSGTPVVVYSGLFAIGRALPPPADRLPDSVLGCLLQAIGPSRTILMPTYTSGFHQGRIDLDATPGITGMVNEQLRMLPSTRRTLSAFFSFVARGPAAGLLARLAPEDAWGDGSLFAWIEDQDAQLLMIGAPWLMCSFLHRAEWITQVPYRYTKPFSGMCVHDGMETELHERLFVRSLNPLVKNVWTGLDDLLELRGMRRQILGRSQIASISARSLLAAVVPELERDPFRFVDNPEEIRAAFPLARSRGPHGSR